MKDTSTHVYPCLLSIILALPFFSSAQQPATLGRITTVRADSTNTTNSIRFRPICEVEQQLFDQYTQYELGALVQELIKKDTHFLCPSIRGTTRQSGRRWVLQMILSQNRNEAFPHLIELVKKEAPPLSTLALELIQNADDQLLKPYRKLFLKKSQSEHPHERYRSFYILQRIKDKQIEHILVKRWKAFSRKQLKKKNSAGWLRLWFELMLYQVKDRTLIEKSILHTLKKKRLPPDALREYLLVLNSFVYGSYDVQIDTELSKILRKTTRTRIADAAAAVLSDSRTPTAWGGLVQALDRGKSSIRAIIAQRLISRGDFEIVAHQLLVERILADSSPEVLRRVASALLWKKPNATQSVVIVKALLQQLSESKLARPERVYLLMRFYLKLNPATRDAVALRDPTVVLQAIELSLNDSEYDRVCLEMTQQLFEQIQGQKKMIVSPLTFWKQQLTR